MNRAYFIAAALLLHPMSASAFRTAADLPELPDGQRIRWTSTPTVYIHEHSGPGVSVLDGQRAAQAATRAWSQPECSGFHAEEGGVSSVRAAPGDGRNTIQWVVGNWAARGLPSDAAATTDVEYVETGDGSWQVAEGDIYLNGDDYTWTGVGEGEARDVQAVLAHEIGHLIGIEHPCELDPGTTVPRCSSLPELQGTTMFPAYLGAEQRDLASDDADAVCYLYPAGEESCRTRCPPGFGCVGSVCTPAVPLACTTDDDCEAGTYCDGRQCIARGFSLGDPCAEDDECASRLCGADGHCTRSCGPASSCPSAYACDDGVCRASVGAFGEACDVGSDCVTDLCLAGSAAMPICTRSCMPGGEACPAGFGCGAVDDRNVCLPVVESGSCSIAPSASAGTAPNAFVLVLLYAFAVLRFRRRQ